MNANEFNHQSTTYRAAFEKDCSPRAMFLAGWDAARTFKRKPGAPPDRSSFAQLVWEHFIFHHGEEINPGEKVHVDELINRARDPQRVRDYGKIAGNVTATRIQIAAGTLTRRRDGTSLRLEKVKNRRGFFCMKICRD